MCGRIGGAGARRVELELFEGVHQEQLIKAGSTIHRNALLTKEVQQIQDAKKNLLINKILHYDTRNKIQISLDELKFRLLVPFHLLC